MGKKDINKLTEDFLDALADSIADSIADKVAQKLAGQSPTCRCATEKPKANTKKKEDKEFKEQLETVSKKIEERKPKPEKKAEKEPESCGVSLEQMQNAAKTVANKLGGADKVKEVIAEAAEDGGTALKDVPESKYLDLLEALEALIEED